MTTEADLIARIVDNADDREAFAVYGDYLIERGDPRGDLIALHAQGRDADAECLLEAHRSTLVGAVPQEVTFRWHLGFVRDAHIEGRSADDVNARIAAVLALPACRFLRRLAIDTCVHLDSIECHRIDRWLATHGGPATIDDISIGWLREHELSDALLEVFPRMARSAMPWPAIASTIAGLDAIDLAIDATTLPTIILTGGAPLPLTPDALLRGLAFEAGGRGDLRLLARLRARCDATSIDRYAARLAELALAPGAQLAWAFPVIELLGGPYTAHTLGSIRVAVNDRLAWQRCLSRLRTPLAHLELFAGSTEGDMLAYVDNVTSPNDMLARAGADPIDVLDRELAARFAELDLRGLEELLATGWMTPLRNAIDLFVHAPRAPRAAGLVWGRRRAGGHSIVRRIFDVPPPDETEPFFLTAAGGVDAMGRPLDIDRDEHVWLAHPAELTDAELATWRTHQRARSPQLSQLDRWLPLPRMSLFSRLSPVRALVDPYPTRAALHARGFTDAPTPKYGTGPAVAKKYRYRDKSHLVTVDLGTRFLYHDNDMVVLHEVARDLFDAARE